MDTRRYLYSEITPEQPRDQLIEASATVHADEIIELYKVLYTRMTQAQETMTRYHNYGRMDMEFQQGDLVWLKGDHIHTKRPSKKLNNKLYGPFPIEKAVHRDRAYKLTLPDSMASIYPVFNVSLLKKYYYPKEG